MSSTAVLKGTGIQIDFTILKNLNMAHKIKFYPVGNGDNVLVKLSDNTSIMIDCQFHNCEEGSDGIVIFDVKSDLLKEIQKDRNGNPFVDLFINTHPHDDHCKGFETHFYSGNPDDYTKANRDKNEIIIGELWVTQMAFSNNLCADGGAIRREAKRRKKLFDDNSPERNKSGNRIRIIGYNDDNKYNSDLHYIPGTTVTTINGKYSHYLSIFIHAPFKSDLIRGKADKDCNAASIVAQMSFTQSLFGNVVSQFIFGGDADHYVWEKVIEKSKNNNNEGKLNWDLFLAPHHCSWSFFNDRPQNDNSTPQDYSLEFLDYRNQGGHIIASSKKIENKKPNPPHFDAKEEYEKKIGSPRFKNTAIHVDEKAPQPLEYIINENGPTLQKRAATASASVLGSTIPRAGVK